MNSSLRRIILLSIALSLFLIGCGSAQSISSKNTPPGGRATVPADSPTPTPTAEPLPPDIVVYPGAQLVLAQRITPGTLYFYRSTAALQAVTAFYIAQMPKQGWTQTSAALNGAQGNFLAYTKDTRSVMLSILSDPLVRAQTDISVTVSDS